MGSCGSIVSSGGVQLHKRTTYLVIAFTSSTHNEIKGVFLRRTGKFAAFRLSFASVNLMIPFSARSFGPCLLRRSEVFYNCTNVAWSIDTSLFIPSSSTVKLFGDTSTILKGSA